MTFRKNRPAARWRWLAAAVVGTGIASGVAAHRPARAAAPEVVIKLSDTLKFTPARVTVKVGETVRWQNASVLVHTVTDDPDLVAREADYALPEGAKPFTSGNIKPGGSYRHTFTVPGTYRYFCIPHEAAGMIAELEVGE